MYRCFQVRLQSSLSKVLPTWEDKDFVKSSGSSNSLPLTMLQKDRTSFQVAFQGCNVARETIHISVTAPDCLSIRLRTVELVPAGYPAKPWWDDGYFSHVPGLYPDILRDMTPIKNGRFPVEAIPNQWRSIWIDVTSSEDTLPGDYTITVQFYLQNGNFIQEVKQIITVCAGILPKQTLLHTEWFHSDCLADYYHVDVWSEEHWTILENFIKVYCEYGMNTILTPLFTPPLDTDWWGERTTVQLIDIYLTENGYLFDFEKFHRWVALCQKYGINYFEIAHLFTQWGAHRAPKIMVWENGVYKQRFGWDSPAVGSEYEAFLDIFLPTFIEELRKLHLEKNVFFHVSDEPSEQQLDSYSQARAIISKHLKDFIIMDALSEYNFYEKGYVDRAVVATNAVEPFLKNKVPNLWVYYCSAQDTKVSNRFITQYSLRNRILGVQLYKFQVEGFLQWGFNFYNDMLSRNHINPYEVTDCGYAFPAGDAFVVYPKEDGTPEESMRLMVFHEGIRDMRALQLLESLTSREHVLALLEEGLTEEITFSVYPKEDSWLIDLRNRVNQEINMLVRI